MPAEAQSSFDVSHILPPGQVTGIQGTWTIKRQQKEGVLVLCGQEGLEKFWFLKKKLKIKINKGGEKSKPE